MRTLLVLVILLGTAWVIRPFAFPAPIEREIDAAVRSLALREFGAAWKAADRALALDAGSASALLLAGYATAGKLDDPAGAIALFERVPPQSVEWHWAELGLARQSMNRGRVERAEQLYRQVLGRDPSNVEANRGLGYLLQCEGRTWESQAYLGRLIFQGQFNGDELLGISSSEHSFFDDPGLELSLRNEPPGDLLIRLGEVRHGLLAGREGEVEPLLREIVSRYPHVVEARARLGRLIAESGERDDFLAWNAGVVPEHEAHPEIWFVRGLFARREGTLRTAVRCFRETLVRSPNHHAAHHQMAGCLGSLGHTELAHEFSRRAGLLSDVESKINLISKAPLGEYAEALLPLLHKLGRHWEAAGWAYISSRFGEPPKAWREIYFDEAQRLHMSEGLTALASQPALGLALEQFPVPDWPRAGRGAGTRGRAAGKPERVETWRFAEHSREAGLIFEHFDGTTEETRLQHIFQAIGGGVGVIDFDRDGWPDLYFTQANDWRQPVAAAAPVDCLFRNTGAGRFEDVTRPAGLGDPDFSYGVAVGDYDNDGWPDVYVGNLGPNRLYHNNGDGTFTDVSEASGTKGDAWSTSCALVDLNADGLADLFVTNYSDREYAIRNPCFSRAVETSCSPDRLPGALNQCYINLGDGRFADVSRESGVAVGTGKGLGLVVADFHGEGRLNVFVGNDSSGNFYFRNAGADSRGIVRFLEEGGISGLACNIDGNAQACMGIAAGDANGDGRLDLLTTNFMREGSTLFLQEADGSFVDATRRAKLREPTFSMLGFGAQFLDVDNDGWQDVVMTNGHVAPSLALGGEDEGDRMPPQLLANRGDGTFAEVSRATLGPFFETKTLGRGLALLDWDRDGRQDFCVSHIHAPAALVTNQTPAAGHRLVVRLAGTTVARDAFGAVGQLRLGQRQLTRHLTAGSGFLAANEPHLWFGLGSGPIDKIDELLITWPGGAVQRFLDLSPDQEILIVEGRSEPVLLNVFDLQNASRVTGISW